MDFKTEAAFHKSQDIFYITVLYSPDEECWLEC